MIEKKNSKIAFRSFISTLLLFSSAILVFTGIIMFITPPGRVAHWTGWAMLGLDKEQWIAVHICFAICVIIASVLHIYLNFTPLMNYFMDKVTRKFAIKMEWIAAALLCIAIFLGAVAAIPPFSTIMDINRDIKFSWEKPSEKAPIPHAETLTLADLAKKADLDLDSMIANLKKAEMGPAKPETVIGQLAEKYNITPNQVFRIATGQDYILEKSGSAVSEPAAYDGQKRGLGRKTLKQFCEEENIDIAGAIEKLKAAGIQAAPDDNMKALADKARTNPHKIAEIAASAKE